MAKVRERTRELGAFVFGRRNTFEVAGGSPTRAAIELDEARRSAICRNADKLTELALGQFMGKLAPGRYRTTPESLLGGCASRDDIKERIRATEGFSTIPAGHERNPAETGFHCGAHRAKEAGREEVGSGPFLSHSLSRRSFACHRRLIRASPVPIWMIPAGWV